MTRNANANAARKTAYLGIGLQSSGTTLFSCCFLQRADLGGVLY